MTKKFVIRTKHGYVTTNKGYFTADLNSARTFKTENAASSNKYMKNDFGNYRTLHESVIVPVMVEIKEI